MVGADVEGVVICSGAGDYIMIGDRGFVVRDIIDELVVICKKEIEGVRTTCWGMSCTKVNFLQEVMEIAGVC